MQMNAKLTRVEVWRVGKNICAMRINTKQARVEIGK